jgi:predicted RNA-binding Zn-ribbon protein involved in translation (DUF1610 family)
MFDVDVSTLKSFGNGALAGGAAWGLVRALGSHRGPSAEHFRGGPLMVMGAGLALHLYAAHEASAAQSKTVVGQSLAERAQPNQRLHSHVCPSCGHEWWHTPETLARVGHMQAHTCPNCGNTSQSLVAPIARVGQSAVSKDLDPSFKTGAASYLPWVVGGLLAGTAALVYARSVA